MSDETITLPCGLVLRRTVAYAYSANGLCEAWPIANNEWFARWMGTLPRDSMTGSEAEALAWLNARVLALRAALLPPGEIVVRDDPETREAVARRLYETEQWMLPFPRPPWTHVKGATSMRGIWAQADAVLAALRERGR